MLSVKQGSIKYYFLSFWYDSTWDWTQVSQAIGVSSKLATLFPGLLHFTLDTYLLKLSVNQSSIKYHFLSLYDSTWEWIQVSETIGKHSTHLTNWR